MRYKPVVVALVATAVVIAMTVILFVSETSGVHLSPAAGAGALALIVATMPAASHGPSRCGRNRS